MNKEEIIIDFSDPDEKGRWEIVNDVVMGGISQSKMVISQHGTAIFQGNLSLENYGGFASVRTYPQKFKFEGHSGLLICVKGDGKKYRLRLRTDDEFDGVAYQAGFTTTSGKWVNIHLPFSEFKPIFRGRIVHDAPKLDIQKIRRIGFMIADKQEGQFILEFEWVKAYSENNT